VTGVQTCALPLSGSGPETAIKLLKIIQGNSNVVFGGFHFHLGSQIEDPSAYVQAFEKLRGFLRKARKEAEFELKFLDIGGGTPVNYGIKVPTPEEIGKQNVERMNELVNEIGKPFELVVESGRFLSAESTVLVSKIVNEKSYNNRKIIYLDTGYHQLLDIALLQQIYPMEVIPSNDEVNGMEEKPMVAGRLCDSMDMFQVGPESKLSEAEIGKLVIIKNVGAYSIVFNMPFHSQVKPAVIYRTDEGEYYLARKKQTIEDLYEEEGGSLLNNEVRI
jgi:diaminopimelate decarboxylase